jgi:hypothetical protein
MTDARPRRPGRPSPAPIVFGAWVAFVAVFVLLALQLRAGRDPALGAPAPSASPAAERKVVVRRIHRRVVVTTVLPPRAHATAPPAPATTTTTSAPTSAPATSAPAAPAPAPAPAPVTTRSS